MKTRYTFSKTVLLILFMVLSMTAKAQSGTYVYGPTIYRTLCPNQALDYRGHLITKPGIYLDTMYTTKGYDSINTLIVNRGYMYFLDQTGSLTENGGTYWWRGRNLTEPGEYFDSLFTATGCDSIYHLTLLQKAVHYIDESLEACADELPLTWRGRQIWSAGTYYDYYATSAMTDSVYRMTLTVHDIPVTYLQVRLCPGETFMWNGTPITVPGVYRDSHYSRWGCDSACVLVVNESHSYYFREESHLNNHGVYAWHGKLLTRDGVYYDSLRTVDGCDSIYELTLHKNPSYYEEQHAEICYSDAPYTWHGRQLYTTGVYYDSLTTRLGNDSIYRLTLTVHAVNYSSRYAEICPGESLTLNNGRIVTKPGVYWDTILTTLGCDSICRITVNMTPSYLYERDAQMNPGGSYEWRGNTYTKAGVYYDSLRTVSGCDSIFKLTLHENPVFYVEASYSTCQSNLPFVWHGKNYFTSGVYYDSLYSGLGVDSVYKMTLTVGQTYEWIEHINLCDGETFLFHGTPITTPGVYSDVLVASNGCDSVRTVIVNRIPGYWFRENHTMAEGDTYLWHGKTLTEEGYYEDAHQTAQGCDSTYTLYLKTWPTYRIPMEATVCQNELPYKFGGRDLYVAGTYENHMLTAHGYDSVEVLTLNILPAEMEEHVVNICSGESFHIGMRAINKTGIYYDTLKNAQGCDHIDKYIVNVRPSYFFYDTIALHDTMKVEWHGQVITAAGTYRDEKKTVYGCDSVYVLTAKAWSDYYIFERATVCEHDLPYIWRGQKLYTQDFYFDFMESSHGTDSVYVLSLTVLYPEYSEDYVEICPGTAYMKSGVAITKPGIYYDTLTAHNGCDSIHRLIVNFSPSYFYDETATMNTDGSYSWHGETYTKAGVYYDSLRTTSGCDSIFRLTLTENRTYYFEKDTAICEMDAPLSWHNRMLYTSGTYYDSLKTRVGNDSIYRLNLTVHPRRISTKYLDICPGQTLSLRWTVISEPGVYYDTIPSATGCDSVVMYVISNARNYLFETDASMHGMTSYEWRGHIYYHGGIYYDTYTTSNGCDSIYRLVLHENPVYYLEEEETICHHETPYTWRNRMLYESGTYFDTVPTAHGTDSVYKLTLTVNPDYLIPDQIDICPNQTFDFRGKTITKPGVYYDSLFASTGCDSVYMLVVNHLPSYVYETRVQISDRDTYTWRGRVLSEPGVYEESIGSLSGCDSIQRLILDVYPTFYKREAVTMCEGGAYTWRGNTYTATGTYYDRYTTVHGYDSIYILDLTVNPVYKHIEYMEVCPGETYEWRGRTLSKAGIYADTLVSSGGCDSILQLSLNIASKYLIYKYGEVCEGELYHFRDQDYSPGVYFETIRTHAGCDSVFCLVVNRAPSYHKVYQEQLCPGETFFFHGEELTAPGTYDRDYKTEFGCDSTYTIILNEAPSYYYRDTIDMTNNETIYWHGQLIRDAGTYYDRQHTIRGCDSIYELTARVHAIYIKEEVVEVCPADLPYNWRGSDYSVSGNYYQTYSTVDGYDSTYVLRLTIHPDFTFTEYKELCPGTTLNWRGQTITTAGIYTDQLSTVHGCDSTFRLIVNIGSTYYYRDTIDLADNQTITWHNQTISAAGTYYDRNTSVSGCDSVYELLVNVYPTYLFVDDVVRCDNEGAYTWRDGNSYTHTGRYYQRYKTVHGMDSVYCLNLTVNKSYVIDEYLQICYGETLNYRGMTITEQGEYIDTLYTRTGCDSIFRLWVTQVPRYFYQTDAQLNENGRYEWRGHIYRERGVYYDSLKSVNGCDSIFQLTLHENPVYYFDEADTVCQNYLPYIWHDKYFYETGIYYDSLKTFVGRDSVYRFTLTVMPTYLIEKSDILCHNSEYYFRGKQYTEAGVYYDTLISIQGCDSVFKLVLNWAPTYHFEEVMTLCDGDEDTWHGQRINHAGTYFDRLRTIHGCDSIYELHVRIAERYYEADSVVICESELPHVWHGKNYYETGIYWDSCKTVDGCDSVYRHALTVQPTYYNEVHVAFCQSDGATFRDQHFYDARIIRDTMLSVSGCDSIVQYVFEPNPTYLFETDASFNPGGSYYWREKTYTHEGVYYDNFKTVTGCDSVYKLTLHKNPVYYFEEEMAVCSQDLPYVWHGNKFYYHSGVYYDSLSTFVGVDSVYKLTLTVYESTYHEYRDTICYGGEYHWRGQRITAAGQYFDTLVSVHGCDSIESLVLNWTPSYLYVDTVTISDQETYLWRGNNYSTPGTYEETLKTYQGCDSIYRLYLTVRPTFYNEENITWCQNDGPYYWHGTFYENSGVYYDRQRTRFGYDSIYELNLTVYPSYLYEERIELCVDGFPYHYKDTVFDAPTIYYDSLKTIHGCDSVYKIVIDYARSYMFEETKQICKGDYYEWRGKMLNKTGVYFDSLKTQAGNVGCDSIYRLELTVTEPFYNLAFDTVCGNTTPYYWRGQTLFDSGTYFDSLRTQSGAIGCDSVYELRLTVRPYEESYDTIWVCHGTIETYRDSVITKTSIFSDTTYNMYGCPKISHVVYDFYPTYYFYEEKNVCEEDTFLWHGQELTYEGRYFDKLTTIYGCDSIYEINITFHRTIHNDNLVYICPDSLPYEWNHNGETITFWRDTVIEEYYRTPEGCDSIYTFTLYLIPKCSEEDWWPLCPDDSIWIYDRYYKEPGHYSIPFNTDMSQNYPDSMYRFEIQAVQGKYTIVDTLVCSNQLPFIYNDQRIDTAGVYKAHLMSNFFCDSVVELRVEVRPAYEQYQELFVCDNEPFYFRGEPITKTGIYTDTLIARLGCDSVIHYVVNFVPTFFIEQHEYLNPNGTYDWHGKTYTRPGVYWDSCQTVHGCDSVYKLYLMKNDEYYFETNRTFCSNEADSLPYFWRERYYNTTGIYYDSLMSITGSDSVYCLRLTILDAPFTSTRVNICPGESFYLRGEQITEPGIYLDTMYTLTGCDSIVQYVVTLNPSFYFEETHYMNPGGQYLWHRNGSSVMLTKPGTYWDSCRTVQGCDSVYRLFLIENDYYYFETVRTFCANDVDSLPYNWRGHDYTASGIYYDSLETRQGADSIYALRLTILDAPFTSTRINLCPGESFYLRGEQITEPGIYLDTLYTLNGCDSVIQYVVTLNPSFYFEETQYMNPGGSYMWHRDGYNVTFTKPGTYWDSCRTVLGCDSVYRLFLIENDHYYFETVRTFCHNEVDSLPYLWRGNYYNATGVYYDSLETRQGADSVYCLKLTVKDAPVSSVRINLCPGESYFFRGEPVTQPGIYTDTMYTIEGCDSIVRYIVTVNPSFFFEETAYLNPGGSYLWHKNGSPVYLTEPGTYFDSCRTVLGCDSVYRLFLVQNDYYYFETNRTFCANEADSLPYRWRGHDYTTTGVYYDSLQTIMGRDSVYCLKLTVHDAPFTSTRINLCRGEIFRFRGQSISKAGIYLDTLQTLHGCDSVVQYVVTFHPDFYFEKTDLINPGSTYTWHRDGAVRIIPSAGVYWDSCKTVGGCDSIYKLTLIENRTYYFIERDTVCENELPYLWHNRSYETTGTYFDRQMTYYGADSIYRLELVVFRKSFESRMYNLCPGEYYDFNGMTISKPGIYYDTLYSSHGCDSIIELLVNHATTYVTERQLQICKDDTLRVMPGVEITRPGIYYDTLRTIAGCDSIFRYVVNVAESFFIDRHASMNPGSTYEWHHCGVPVMLTEPGVYWDSCRTVSGCDSIWRLELSVNHEYSFREEKHICLNDEDYPYFWHGQTLYDSGTYYDSLFTFTGRDSVFVLNLTVDSIFIRDEQVFICKGDTFYMGGKPYTEMGTYCDTLLSSIGCDSIIRLHLNHYQTYKFVEYRQYGINDVHEWQGMNITHTGIYTKRYGTIYGCDSIYELHATVYQAAFNDTIIEVCYGDIFYLNGTRIRSNGDYYDTLRTDFGQDSIVCYHVRFHDEIPVTIISVDICDGDTLYINDEKIFKAGTYEETFLSRITGCDSVVRHIVNKNQAYHFEERYTFCENTVFEWPNHPNPLRPGTNFLFDRPGVYYDSCLTVNGCDSIYTIYLTGKGFVEIDTTILVCYDELPYEHNGVQYWDRDSTFHDTLHSVNGCDSIRHMHYVRTTKCSEYETSYFCENELPVFDNRTITESGTYRFNQWTNEGLDSVYRTVIKIVPTYVDTIPLTECDSVVFDGHVFRASTSVPYAFRYESVYGCDSTVYVNVVVNKSSRDRQDETFATIFDFDAPYFWYSVDGTKLGEYSASGNYEVIGNTPEGCDRFYELHLNVIHTDTMIDIQDLVYCKGDPSGITVYGHTYYPTENMEVTYLDTNRIKGVSIVYKSYITVLEPTTLTDIYLPDGSICGDAYEFSLGFRVTGSMPQTYRVEFLDTYASQYELPGASGQVDATGIITVPMNHDHNCFVTPNYYHVRLTVDNVACGSVYMDTVLLIKYPSWIIEQNWNNVVAVLNNQTINAQTYCGNYEFSAIEWFVNDVSAGSSDYLYTADNSIINKYVHAELVREGETQAIPTCPILIRDINHRGGQYGVRPNAAPQREPDVNIVAPKKGEYFVFDAAGYRCGNGTFTEGETPMALPAVPGYYLVVLKAEDGYITTEKVVIY